LVCAKSTIGTNGKAGIESCVAPFSCPTPGTIPEAQRNWLATGANIATPVDAVNYGIMTLGATKNFQIPLGLYSSLINSHSILPIGLFSSYAVNGWQIELYTNSQPVEIRNYQFDMTAAPVNLGFAGQKFWHKDAAYTVGGLAGDQAGININYNNVAGNVYMRNLMVRAQVIKVLDPAVMEAVLSLYEKRETVNLGGMSFPLSLRLNSIGYRFYNQTISADKSEYHFRIPTTDRSVRAIGWIVQSSALRTLGLMYNDRSLVLTKLETRIGTEIIHPCLNDGDTYSSTCTDFVNLNLKKCGYLFSPFAQYLEGKPRDISQDIACEYNNTNGNFTPAQTNRTQDVNLFNVTRAGGGHLVAGAISFENLDRREQDFQGNYQASGKDCTNVGSIEMIMRFNNIETAAVAALNPAGNQDDYGPLLLRDQPGASYDITFIIPYDNVMECSPQGIMDVTNAVL
jgi:hypothetical protein